MWHAGINHCLQPICYSVVLRICNKALIFGLYMEYRYRNNVKMVLPGWYPLGIVFSTNFSPWGIRSLDMGLILLSPLEMGVFCIHEWPNPFKICWVMQGDCIATQDNPMLYLVQPITRGWCWLFGSSVPRTALWSPGCDCVAVYVRLELGVFPAPLSWLIDGCQNAPSVGLANSAGTLVMQSG